ncbi:MAG: arginine--tRNA ligase [Oligoflexia bacterium]|nr:arginine--tRNA ligase [Oligoflexia bacterium]
MKKIFNDEIKFKISTTILHAIKKLINQNSQQNSTSTTPIKEFAIEDIYSIITDPPDISMGHYALPTFTLAKIFKKSPNQIAADLTQILTDSKNDSKSDIKPDTNLNTTADQNLKYSLIEKYNNLGPYINISICLEKTLRLIIPKIINSTFFKIKLAESLPKTMIEFSQPNTHKELHVGHMRNLSLGHTLILIYRYCGYNIISATFPGDVGTHVAKCLWYLKYHVKQEDIPENNRGTFLGQIYSKAHAKLENEKGSATEEKNREQLTLILAQLHDQKGDFFDLWKETREWSLNQMKDIYKWANVSFDQWYFESEVDAPSIKLAKEYYQKGIFINSDGAIGIDLSTDGLGFCMMIKSDGNGLYATKDLELARRKFEEHNIEKNIYVVDVRQSHHFAQVFKVLEKVGFKNAKNCIHLAYDFVELPEGIISSRSGKIVALEDLIAEMICTIKTNYLEQYRNNWSDSEIDSTANQIALGAIQYGMLKIDPQKKIVFDMKEWLKLDGESGPYLQYVHARINSLIKKVLEKFPDFNLTNPNADIYCNYKYELLKHPSEEALTIKLLNFNNAVIYACENNKPSFLCSYLYDLCKLYNSFYSECPILQASEGEEQTYARIILSKCMQITLKKGLELLGIPTPERM